MLGFFIGLLGGFFGVGGSFIAGPTLRALGLDWNFAVGTDLAHIVGTSVVAAKRHRALGNVDLRLGLIMAIGTIVGAELGAQFIQILKRAGNVNFVVSVVSIIDLFQRLGFHDLGEQPDPAGATKGAKIRRNAEERERGRNFFPPFHRPGFIASSSGR